MRQFLSAAVILTAGLLFARQASAQTISDSELKVNVAPVNHALQSILQLQPKTFEYNTARFPHLNLSNGKQYGFMADNMQTVFPQLVSSKFTQYMYGKNSYRNAVTSSIDANSLIPVLVASIQELHAEVERLKEMVKALEKGK